MVSVSVRQPLPHGASLTGFSQLVLGKKRKNGISRFPSKVHRPGPALKQGSQSLRSPE